MMLRLLFVFSILILINSKSISSRNSTTTTSTTTISAISTETTTPIETSTILHPTTVKDLESTTMTTTVVATTLENNKSYEFQSNFSRNNDSVFVSLHSNASDVFVSINNTFRDTKNSVDACEIVLNEHSTISNSMKMTKIFINFNGSFTRDLASQIGDRLIDMADLLTTVRLMVNQNSTVETV